MEEVLWCAKEGLSLYHLQSRRIYPAAVICNWQLKLVDDIIKKGLLYRVLK